MFIASTAARADIEGFGTSTAGGAGGETYLVTTLNDSGPGSLRDAVSTGNRMVVFTVGGTITLSGPIFVRGANITIDGLTAPAPGITLVGDGLVIRGNVGANNPTPAHDIIVRGLRIRSVPIDAIQVAFGAYNVVISNVSAWDSGDGLIDITENSHDVTVARSVLAGAVKAMLIKYNVSRVTLVDNILVGGRNRNPQVSVDDVGTPATDTTLDMRNNLVYDWAGGSGTTIHHGARANVVANFFSSPASPLSDQEQALIVCHGGGCFDGDPLNAARAFTQDNVSGDFLAVDINDAGTENAPFPAAPVTTDDACPAARRALERAGARNEPAWSLDALDVQFLASISLPICRRTTTALTATDSPTTLGAPVTFTAAIDALPPAVGSPSGTVVFTKAGDVMGTAPVVNGIATLVTTDLPQGTTAVKATYSGDDDFESSYTSIKHKVIGAPTSTALTAVANPSYLGVPVTLTATVTALPPSTAVPRGTVRFFDGTKVLGNRELVDGVATLVTSTLPAGFRKMKAQFLGDTGFAGSVSTTLSLRIDGGTTTALTRTPSRTDIGQTATFTATVSSLTGDGTPTGTVTFRDGTVVLDTRPLTGGVAGLTISSLPVGTHRVTASYSGSTSFEPSTSPELSLSVVKGSTKTTLSVTPLSVLLAQPVTIRAVVVPLAPAVGTPSGPMKFKDGATTLATVNLVAGAAQIIRAFTLAGTHSISAMYGGSEQFQTSNSNKISIRVNP